MRLDRLLNTRAYTLVATLFAVALLASAARGQGAFGANKVLYQPLEWLVTRSPHVELYFYPEEQRLARRTLALAESCCVEYEARLEHRLSSPIPLFLYSSHRDFESTNILSGVGSEDVGGVTELLRGRVLVPHTGSYARLRHVVRHELAHAFMLDQLRAASHRHKAILRQQPPLWLVEGWAEHLSGGWTTEDDMVLRSAMLAGMARPMERLWQIEGTFLMYKEGQSLLDSTAARVGGTHALGRFFETWPLHQELLECAREAWKDSLPEIARVWFHDLRRKYYPMVAYRREATEVATLLKSPGHLNLRPAAVPGTAGDSLEVVHFSDQGQYPGVWLWKRSKTGQHSERLVRAGNRRSFESLHFFETRLAVNRRREVALVSRKGEHDVVHVLRARDGEVLETYELPGLVSLSSPNWSSGGDSLVVRGQDLSGDADLFLIERRTGKWTRLMHDSYDDRSPAFRPDGSAITFSSDRGPDGREGHTHLFDLHPDGSITGLTSGPGHEGSPSWSADGTQLLFVSDRETVPDLYLYRPALGSARLTCVQGAAWDPTFSDSTHVVFSEYARGEFQMYELAVAESALVFLPETPSEAPGWEVPEAPRETTVRPYHRRWGVGIAQTAIQTDRDVGTGPAGQIALADMLGNEEIQFFLSSSSVGLDNLIGNLDVSATYVNQSRRMLLGGGVFRLNQVYDSRFDLVRTEHRTGGLLVAAYPLSRFDRVETSLVFRHVENHLFSDGVVAPADLVSHYLGFSHDNSWYSEQGFTAGWRGALTMGQTRDVRRYRGNFWSARADLRTYQQVLPDVVWASRIRAEFVSGEDAEPIALGGFGELRGFRRRSYLGTRLVQLNQDLRFPAIRTLVLSLPGGGMRLPDIQGAVFADAAWFGTGEWERPVGSVGGSLYMGGGYFPAVRFDLAWRFREGTWEGKATRSFGLGFNF